MRHVSPHLSLVIVGSLLGVSATGGASRDAPYRVPGMAGNSLGDSAVTVKLVLTGDVGQYAGMCGALGGWDSLTGVLVRQGRGPVARDEDVLYAGRLSRKSEIKACGTKPAPTEDQVDVCSATLVGKAKMNVDLEVYEGDRGAYIKMAADTTHPVDKTISGCPEARDWLSEYYPDGASGIDISTVPSGLLQDGKTYSEAGVSLKVGP